MLIKYKHFSIQNLAEYQFRHHLGRECSHLLVLNS